MIKFLLLNVGCLNKGNVALVNTTKNAIRTYIPDSSFNFIGFEYKTKVKEQIGLNYGISFKNMNSTLISTFFLIKCFYIRLVTTLGIKYSISNDSKLAPYYECNVVINSGGDHLSGESGIGALSTFLDIVYALILNKPVILYGESLGYFKSSTMNFITRIILNRTKLILVREQLSKKYLL